MTRDHKVWCQLVAALTILPTGCSTGRNTEDCAFYGDWANRLRRDSIVFTPSIISEMRAVQSNKDRIKIAIRAEEMAIKRIRDLSEQLQVRSSTSEMYQPSMDVIQALVESGHRTIDLLRKATGGDLDDTVEYAQAEQLQTLEQALLRFDMVFEMECR